jgi:transposase
MKGMKKYIVRLSDEEREELTRFVSRDRGSARMIRRAQMLLRSDEGKSDEQIASMLGVRAMAVHNVRKQYVEEGVERTLQRRPGYRPKAVLDGVAEAHLIALSCSEPPKGQERWTLRLLAGKMVELGYVPAVSHETVRQVLKKTRSSRG